MAASAAVPPGAVLPGLILVVLLSGCVMSTPPTDAETLILRYTLIDEDGENDHAHPGEHCGRAFVDEDVVRIARPDMDAFGDQRPLLVILPSLEGPWSTLGDEGYARPLPHAVDPGVEGDDAPIALIGWEGDPDQGHAQVDGETVDLPRNWTARPDQGGWRVEAELSRGPDRVEHFEPGTCM